MLVTGALDSRPEPLSAAEIAGAAQALVAAGIYAADLHPGNFLHLAAGGVAVLDLQSARLRSPGLTPRLRLRMAAKILSECPECGGALVEVGLLPPEWRRRAEQRAAEVRAAGVLRRIRRCLLESSEFSVTRSMRGTEYQRRSLCAGSSIEGGAELVRCWIGDRTLEVLDRRPPCLAALFRKSWWLRGGHSVKMIGPEQAADLAAVTSVLLEGFDRFEALRRVGRGQAARGRPGRSS